MKLWTLFLVLWCAVLSQQCKVPDTNSVTENSLPKKIDPNFGHYPKHRIRRLTRGKPKLKKSIQQESAALETKCLARERKFNFPLPAGSQLIVSQTCSLYDTQIELPTHVEIDGYKCWVLKPWAGKRCSYIKCNGDNCDVPKSPRTIPVDDQYKCRPTNPRIVKVFAYCEKKVNYHDTEISIKFFEVPLPQCCSCLRFQCQRKG